MIITNITTQVSWTMKDEWLKWLRDEHLPSLMSTGCFTHYRIVQVLEVPDDDGPTYAVQLFTEKMESVDRFREQFLVELEKKERAKWSGHAFSFRTLMEVIN
jgi:Domain of unknown function (DUF4286)